MAIAILPVQAPRVESFADSLISLVPGPRRLADYLQQQASLYRLDSDGDPFAELVADLLAEAASDARLAETPGQWLDVETFKARREAIASWGADR